MRQRREIGIAIGRRGVDVNGAGIWVSADGTTWQRALLNPEDFPAGTEIFQLLTTGGRLLAIGELWQDIYNGGGEWVDYTFDARVWTSEDGIEWTPVADDQDLFTQASIDHAVAWERGITAFGADCEDKYACTGVTWNSRDGLSWTRMPFDSGLGVPAHPTTIGLATEGLIAMGEEDVESEDAPPPIVYFWTSHDGVTWEVYDADPDVFPGLRIGHFVWHENRLIGVGSAGSQGPAVYIWNP